MDKCIVSPLDLFAGHALLQREAKRAITDNDDAKLAKVAASRRQAWIFASFPSTRADAPLCFYSRTVGRKKINAARGKREKKKITRRFFVAADESAALRNSGTDDTRRPVRFS